MDFDRYRAARQTPLGEFDAELTQKAIARVLGPHERDAKLASKLEAWVESRMGPAALDGIAPSKWSFVRLPPTGAHGLAGGREGSEALVDSVIELRHTPGRTAPEME